VQIISLAMTALLLGACASGPELSEGEQQINQAAKERRKEERFPVLSPLPRDEVLREQATPDADAGELIAAAMDLSGVRASAAAPPPPQNLQTVVDELRAEVARLRAEAGRQPEPPIDVQALEFPTPPPRD